VAGWWFSPGIPVSSTNETDRHDINEILLKGEVSTININQPTIIITPILIFVFNI